jgi:hypothetical protein
MKLIKLTQGQFAKVNDSYRTAEAAHDAYCAAAIIHHGEFARTT